MGLSLLSDISLLLEDRGDSLLYKIYIGEQCLANLSFRHAVGHLVHPPSILLAVFFWTVQKKRRFCFWIDYRSFSTPGWGVLLEVWGFSNFSFYLGSRKETRRYHHCVDIISADTTLPALPFPLPQAVFKDNDWVLVFLETQPWLQQRNMFSGYITTHRKWQGFFVAVVWKLNYNHVVSL